MQLWENMTAAFVSLPRGTVHLAMDRRVRRRYPWRFRVWFGAWGALLIAYIPVHAAVAVLLRALSDDWSWQWFVVVVPPIAIGLMMLGAYVRQLFGPVIPAELTVSGLSRDVSGGSPEAAPSRSAAQSRGNADRPRGPRARPGSDRWTWVGAILLTVAAVAKLWLMM